MPDQKSAAEMSPEEALATGWVFGALMKAGIDVVPVYVQTIDGQLDHTNQFKAHFEGPFDGETDVIFTVEIVDE